MGVFVGFLILVVALAFMGSAHIPVDGALLLGLVAVAGVVAALAAWANKEKKKKSSPAAR